MSSTRRITLTASTIDVYFDMDKVCFCVNGGRCLLLLKMLDRKQMIYCILKEKIIKAMITACAARAYMTKAYSVKIQ